MLRVGVVAGFGRSNWLTPGKETGAVVRLPASEVVGTCGREFSVAAAVVAGGDRGRCTAFPRHGQMDGTVGVSRSDGDAGNGRCDTLCGPAELRRHAVYCHGSESRSVGVRYREPRRRGPALRRSEVTLGFSSDTEYKLNQQTARAASAAIHRAAPGLAGRFRVRHTPWIAAQKKAAKH